MSAVQLSEISFAYENTSTLDSCSLSLGLGEYLVVIGASGSGKTTLLRLIAGLELPHRGSIRIREQDVTTVDPRKRDLAYVPQQHGLYPHLSIGKSIAIGVSEKLPAQELQRRVDDAAKKVRLTDLLHRLPHELSGGQQRRAALAKALAKRSFLRLFDEPLSAVDAAQRFQIESDLKTLHHSVEGATIHVTHDGREAMRLADRIAVLDGGRIVQHDTPENAFRHPASPVVAATLGNTPFHLAEVKRTADGWVSIEGESLQGPHGHEPEVFSGDRALVGYYESDCHRFVETHSVTDEVWINSTKQISIRPQDIRWFDVTSNQKK